MITYNNEWLQNLHIQEQANQVFFQGLINAAELKKVREKYASGFYMPNIFIRIGFFLLTIVIILFSSGLVTLVLLDLIEKVWAIISIILGITIYAILGFFVHKKRHYRSGIDEALLWATAGFVFAGTLHFTGTSQLAICLVAFVISAYGVLRFVDRGMAVVGFLSFYGVMFELLSNAAVIRPLLPFFLIVLSAVIYFIMLKLKRIESLILYRDCIQWVSLLALLFLYISGNYFAVRELSNELFDLHLTSIDPMPLGWFFWLFTILTPVVYLIIGILKKDRLLLNIGLLLSVISIITFQNYYHPFSIEVLMILSGILIVCIPYFLNKYLATPVNGFVSTPYNAPEDEVETSIESLIIAETFSTTPVQEEPTSFGGGNFGGGGSSGTF